MSIFEGIIEPEFPVITSTNFEDLVVPRTLDLGRRLLAQAHVDAEGDQRFKDYLRLQNATAGYTLYLNVTPATVLLEVKGRLDEGVSRVELLSGALYGCPRGVLVRLLNPTITTQFLLKMSFGN